MTTFREEFDSIGMKEVPIDAYYGVQSLRAAENFRITGTKVHPEMITDIHYEYLMAGSRIIKTNTFGCNSLKFDKAGEIKIVFL